MILVLLSIFMGCQNTTLKTEPTSTPIATAGQPTIEPAPTPTTAVPMDPYQDSATIAKYIFDPAISLYCNFVGLKNIKLSNKQDSGYHYENETQIYVLADDPRYPNYQVFYDDLCNHFSDEIVQKLLLTKFIIEHDGQVYVSTNGDRGTDVYFYDVRYAVTSRTPEKVVLTATVRYIKGSWFIEAQSSDKVLPDEAFDSKDYVYNYELIDGKWVFTNFELFY
jgi:hypothetical protein